MEFKDRLTKLRKDAKLYQVDMAKKIGVARATYGAYEQGTRQPDFETLQLIADSFGVSTDYLLGRTNNESRHSSTDDEFEQWLSNPADERFFEEYNQAPEERRAALREMWEILKKQGKA